MIFNLTPPAEKNSFDKMLKDKNIKVRFEYTRHTRVRYFKDYDIYSIQIDTVEDLLYLINTLKPRFGLVISKADTKDDYAYDLPAEPHEFTLEIYDSWRE